MSRVLTLSVAMLFLSSAAWAQQPCTTDARRVVDELYRHMLERPADAGSAGFVQRLQNGQASVRDIVRDIAKSAEHDQRFIKQENGEETPYLRSVNTLYRHILGRQPDANGARGYAQMTAQRGVDPVIDEIVGSAEYTQQYGDWSAPGSGGVSFCAPRNFNNNGNNSNNNNGNYSVVDNAPVNARARGRNNNVNNNPMLPRFQNMDSNGDGVITRNEFQGNANAFTQRDWNGDGILSGTEVRDGSENQGGYPAATAGQGIYINPTQRWTDSGIDVVAGDVITFDAQGTVELSADSNDVAEPFGSRSGRRAIDSPVPSAPAGVLIARIGNGQAVAVGNRRTLRVPSSGRLYLGVNDDHLNDNAGEFRVNVSVQGR